MRGENKIECTLSGNYESDCTTLQCKIVIARKGHICEECNKTIIKDERYEVYNGIYDGTFYWVKTCMDCGSLRDSFFPGGEYMIGNILDEISEHVVWELAGDVDEKCIAPLTPAAKDIVFELMEEGWQR